ncbi:MAG: UvrD-helicase domain-containing protein [Acidimicrobiales bacterium]|nr:UvrD-helicase domain-containing protein [Acidimicrobiales bacterium]
MTDTPPKEETQLDLFSAGAGIPVPNEPEPSPPPAIATSAAEPVDPAAVDPADLPADEAQRERIRSDRSATLFVEAGAGSGKTRALVNRVEALVLEDRIGMESIAAITFTEKAAAELRDRIRQRFETAARTVGEADDAERHALATAALAELDGAAVGTLHSFAQRILNEHPVEAGLPPGVEVLDEIGSQVEFEAQWHQFLDELLDDATMGRSILALEAARVRLDTLRQLALQMTDNWDLVAERLDRSAAPPPPFDLADLLARFDDVAALREHCTDETDKLLDKFTFLHESKARLAAGIDEIDHMAIAAGMGEKGRTGEKITAGPGGKKDNWSIPVAEVKEAIKQLAKDCDAAVAVVTSGALAHIAGRLGDFVITMATERQETGRLEFHDLLVHARRVLRSPEHGAEVRQSLRDRYTRLLLDEFQDTDPIQIELAALIAATDAEIAGKEWSDLDIEAGRLFLVGDPKQSIYRFRRADISVYLAARDRFPGGPSLTVNFRTVAPVIEWINDVFSVLIQPKAESQPEYAALTADRTEPAPTGPGIALLGAEPIAAKLNADGLREAETHDIAATVAAALHGPEPWQVDDGEQGWRTAEPSDVCILLPARTSLSFLERALDRVGIPYRAETSSLVYATREVRELMLALRAVADPTDELATVAALRSFVYGCGDDDLAHWRLGLGGRFSLRRDLPEGAGDHPVADGLRHLAALHEARLWSNPAELLDQLVRDRGVLETAVATGAPRDVWRRLRFVIDQARAWTDAGGRDLRAYLEWARLQGADNARVSETVLPETDDDSVRIMTIHGAKGLEFPITVLGGMTTQMARPPMGPSISFPPGRDGENSEPVLRLSSTVTSDGYDAWKPVDEQMDEDERLRLMYVAATRACDHLVVCLHRLGEGGRKTSANVIAEPGLASAAGVPYDAPPATVPANPRPTPVAMPPRDEWAAERRAALAAASRRTVIAATTLASEAQPASSSATSVSETRYISTNPGVDPTDPGPGPDLLPVDPGLDKRPRDLDLPPWQKGRYGTAVGRAVHGVLQVVDLVTGDGIDDAARAQSMAEGVANRTEVVARLARSGVDTAAARAAAAGEHWRELWVAAPIGDFLIEGYIDLLYRDAEGGLVIVDWKTDHVDVDDDVAAKLDRYRLQGASYAAAIEQAVGEPVTRMVFAFLREDGATERELPDLRAAIDEVSARAAELARESDTADALL